MQGAANLSFSDLTLTDSASSAPPGSEGEQTPLLKKASPSSAKKLDLRAARAEPLTISLMGTPQEIAFFLCKAAGVPLEEKYFASMITSNSPINAHKILDNSPILMEIPRDYPYSKIPSAVRNNLKKLDINISFTDFTEQLSQIKPARSILNSAGEVISTIAALAYGLGFGAMAFSIC